MGHRTLAFFLQTLIPQKLRPKYWEKIHTKVSVRLYEERKETEKQFACICPVFQNETITEKVHALENIICNFSSDYTIQQVLRNWKNSDIVVCLYAMREEARKKIIDNMSTRLAALLIEDVVYLTPIAEQKVLKSIEETLRVTNRLLESGEIPAPF